MAKKIGGVKAGTMERPWGPTPETPPLDPSKGSIPVKPFSEPGKGKGNK